TFGAPRVTVIVPTYNWATVLPYSIGSALDQTMGDFELLVIGDGCTDESEQVVRGIRDRRVQWHNLRVNGKSQAGPNGLGLRLARGRLVAYLGHDDLWLPRHLERLVAALDAGATLAHGRQLRLDPGARPYLSPGPHYRYQRGAWLPPTSAAHVRDAARLVGGWRFPHQTGALDPEADLWRRLHDEAGERGAPVFVPALTSVKLPATLRHGVYKTRPHHEQEAWLQRIRAARDAETELLAACDGPPVPDPRGPGAHVIPPEVTGEVPLDAVARHAVRRKFKGLDD
ncbi:MAG: glycosyltransferase family 2 protein, partial [Deltaproteobacteria bacterium]|nr:glycosyltransferase family 2 protein [Deltaproteobacteria bacterium]